VVTFSKFGGVTLGMFRHSTRDGARQSTVWRSQKSAFFKHSLGEESGMRGKVIQALESDYGGMRDRYGGGAWFLLTRILWAIQQELFVPTAKAASDTIDNTWERCQEKASKAYGEELMLHVYKMQQR